MNKKVEKKLKAYYAVDEHSFNCLIKELEEQEYDVKYAKDSCPGKDVIYIEKDETIMVSSLRYYEEYEKDHYELIEYHKEPKPKAYHVKDEYSYNELMKELEEQGYVWSPNQKPTGTSRWGVYEDDTVIYGEEDKCLSFSDLCYFDYHHKNSYSLIEYHKEEPKFYAKIKGWELNGHDDIYWIYDSEDNIVFVGYTERKNEFGLFCYMTKTKWNELGINNTNADWEEVVE